MSLMHRICRVLSLAAIAACGTAQASDRDLGRETLDPDNGFAAMGSVAVGALPPGDYIVRAIVGLEGSAPTRVVRTLRKSSR